MDGGQDGGTGVMSSGEKKPLCCRRGIIRGGERGGVMLEKMMCSRSGRENFLFNSEDDANSEEMRTGNFYSREHLRKMKLI